MHPCKAGGPVAAHLPVTFIDTSFCGPSATITIENTDREVVARLSTYIVIEDLFYGFGDWFSRGEEDGAV